MPCERRDGRRRLLRLDLASLESASEEWLWERFLDPADAELGWAAFSAILAGLDGARAAAMRADRRVFDEEEPYVFEADDEDGDGEPITLLTSDPLFEVLFVAGAITPLRAIALGLVLGFLPEDDPELVGRACEGSALEDRRALLSRVRAPEAAGTAQIAALHGFFAALFRAA